jgi:hypothetical protein
MTKKTLLFSLIASVVLTFTLAFVGNYVEMMNSRREFEIALQKYRDRPKMGILEREISRQQITTVETESYTITN